MATEEKKTRAERKAERKANSKGLIKEFKEFITRGNVIDLAVGVIIGGAFTAIVTALTSQILQPLINWLISAITGGQNGLEACRTVLGNPVYITNSIGEEVIDWSKTNYIDWGAFISAVINFLLVAIILFAIVKIINTVHAKGVEAKAKIEAEVIAKAAEKGAEEAEKAE